MQEDFDQHKLRPFLSIRWKLFLALACLIFLTHTIFAIGFLNYQKYSFEQLTQGVRDERINFLNVSIESAAERLHERLNNLLLAGAPKGKQSLTALQLQITENFTAFSKRQMISSLALYDQNMQLIKHWGENSPLSKEKLQAKPSGAITASGINCAIQCSIYVISQLPISEIGNVTAVIQQNAAVALDKFSTKNQLQVGLLKDFPEKAEFASWEEQVLLLSHSSINMPLLVKLSQSVEQLAIDSHYAIEAFDNKYSISFKDSGFDANKWLFIHDITVTESEYRARVTNIFLLSLFSLIISMCLLYVIVNRISHQLPRILAMSQALGFEDEVVSDIDKFGNKRILDDELQQYDRQLAKISHKMDVLRQAESNSAIKLQAMVRELNQTKSFIDRLLNDQQTIILVQKLGGEIIALNQAGSALFEIEDFNGLTYAEIFCSDLLEEDGLAALNYLYLGGETLVKAEVQWRNSKGELFILLWVHALLSVPGTIDPVILSICVDITAQRKAEDRLEWLAFNDPSLINYNKQVFLEYLPFAITRSLERHKILALLYCEVNGFPQLNEVQDTNSKIMKDLSERMSGCLRQYDMLTQLNDEHFVIILEGLSDIVGAEVVTEKIISSFQTPVELANKEYYLKVTIGASYAPEHTESVPELLRNAEMAMFQAKRKNLDYFSAVISED